MVEFLDILTSSGVRLRSNASLAVPAFVFMPKLANYLRVTPTPIQVPPRHMSGRVWCKTRSQNISTYVHHASAPICHKSVSLQQPNFELSVAATANTCVVQQETPLPNWPSCAKCPCGGSSFDTTTRPKFLSAW